jgi:hypothetical protein
MTDWSHSAKRASKNQSLNWSAREIQIQWADDIVLSHLTKYGKYYYVNISYGQQSSSTMRSLTMQYSM